MVFICFTEHNSKIMLCWCTIFKTKLENWYHHPVAVLLCSSVWRSHDGIVSNKICRCTDLYGMNEKWGKKIFLDRWMQPVYTHIIKISQKHLLHEFGILEELLLEKPDGFGIDYEFLRNSSKVTMPPGSLTKLRKKKLRYIAIGRILSLVYPVRILSHGSRFLPIEILLTKVADFAYFLVRNIWFANAPRWRRLCRWNAPTRHDVISFLGLMHNQSPSKKVLQWALFIK